MKSVLEAALRGLESLERSTGGWLLVSILSGRSAASASPSASLLAEHLVRCVCLVPHKAATPNDVSIRVLDVLLLLVA